MMPAAATRPLHSARAISGAASRRLRGAITWLLLITLLVLTTACRAGRAPPMPQPTNFAQFLAIVVFVVGGWWLLLKILRG
jgi:hypothetical protein